MFTKTEKGYLILTLGFLAAGSGIKAYRHAAVRLGPFSDAASLGTDAVSPGAESVPSGSPASDSALAGPSAGPDLRGGPDSQSPEASTQSPEAYPQTRDGSGGDAVGAPPSGAGDPDSARPAAAAMGKAAEKPRTPRAGAGKSAFAGKVDLNKADASELTRVNGIGAKTAQAIVDYRRAHGPYRNLRDLLRIKGIGEKKLEKLTPNLIL